MFNQILKEIKIILNKISKEEIQDFINEIRKSKRIYLIGVGRSGLVAKNLAIRLVRLGKETYVVHETVNPKINFNDLLIAISGSGETKDVLDAVKISRMMGARIFSFTADKNSSLSKLSHKMIFINAKVPKRLGDHYFLRELIGVPERSATKSLFEIATLIFLEVVITKI